MIDIKSMTIPELESFLTELKQPKFRAKQIFSWLHEKRVLSFNEMTNLPASLREQLKENLHIHEPYGGAGSWSPSWTGR